MEGAPPRSGAVVVVASLVVFETASIAFLVVVASLMVSRTALATSLVVVVRAASHQQHPSLASTMRVAHR
jgi:hypothetical protein